MKIPTNIVDGRFPVVHSFRVLVYPLREEHAGLHPSNLLMSSGQRFPSVGHDVSNQLVAGLERQSDIRLQTFELVRLGIEEKFELH